ncbi:MAG: ABC transporter ATP-binding protein [Sphingomonadales bacterium]|jgi:sodium transport system ATP-binding protein
MIEVNNLAKSFGKIEALKNVSFKANDGEITTLLGSNGSGKTTTLRTVCGLIRCDGGDVYVNGTSVHENPIKIREDLGFVPDEFGLYPRLTAREHMNYFAGFHNFKGAEKEKAVHETLTLLNMHDLADRRTEGFSLGERSKVALARALVNRPQNIILDEPTRGLDVVNIRLLRSILNELRAQGRCLLFSSHVMSEVQELSDRVVIIADGQVVADASPEDIIKEEGRQNLEDAFVKLIGNEEKIA